MANARHNTLFSALNIPFCFVQTQKYSLKWYYDENHIFPI